MFAIRSHYATPGAFAAVLTRRSLLMLPALAVSAAVGGLIGFWMLSARDLDGSEPIAEQGAYGWMVRVLANGIILVTPSYAGLWFAVRARRLGGGRLSLIAVAAHLGIIGLVWTLIAISN
ncbi:MAG: hypothetical protein ACKO27_06000 [Ilumatobacteraceae bacterium]